jgi:ribonuclease R
VPPFTRAPRRATGRTPRTPRDLPETLLVDIVGVTQDGEPVGRPVEWPGNEAPRIVMAPERKGQPALAPGDRVLARLRPVARGGYEGRTIRRIAGHVGRILGVFRRASRHGGRIEPADRRSKAEWRVAEQDIGGAEPGELVLAEPLPQPGLGLKPARIIQRLGDVNDARAISLLAIHAHGIPDRFDEATLAEAGRAGGVGPDGREDLRSLPLVTIDGADARDFDDAVFAEPDGRGWRLVVAIADVAHYVRAGSALDRTAEARGNSVYFPDRVVPMLPEALSNGWCSLKPGQDRGCLFVEMRVDAGGRKTGHRFGRGLMRSAARLTYEEVQQAVDAGTGVGVPAERIGALYGAFRALLAARQARGTLDLDLPERKVVLDEAGRVASVMPRPRLDSHRLIEEFMVLANVAAAEELERHAAPCMYRVHDRPSEEKAEGLRAFLAQFGISLPARNMLHPRDLDGVLQRIAGTDAAPVGAGAASWRRRAGDGGGGTVGRAGHSHHGHGTAGRGGGTRRAGPLPGRVHGRSRGTHVPGAHLRRGAVRAVRDIAGHRRQRSDPRVLPA